MNEEPRYAPNVVFANLLVTGEPKLCINCKFF
jgi:hypothetical protein